MLREGTWEGSEGNPRAYGTVVLNGNNNNNNVLKRVEMTLLLG